MLPQAGNYGISPPEFPTKVYVSSMLDRVISVNEQVRRPGAGLTVCSSRELCCRVGLLPC